MKKKNFSKQLFVLMLTAVLMLSCIGTAAAASIQMSQEDVTETEVALQESQDQDTQEISQVAPTMPEAFETEQAMPEESLEAG